MAETWVVIAVLCVVTVLVAWGIASPKALEFTLTRGIGTWILFAATVGGGFAIDAGLDRVRGVKSEATLTFTDSTVKGVRTLTWTVGATGPAGLDLADVQAGTVTGAVPAPAAPSRPARRGRGARSRAAQEATGPAGLTGPTGPTGPGGPDLEAEGIDTDEDDLVLLFGFILAFAGIGAAVVRGDRRPSDGEPDRSSPVESAADAVEAAIESKTAADSGGGEESWRLAGLAAIHAGTAAARLSGDARTLGLEAIRLGRETVQSPTADAAKAAADKAAEAAKAATAAVVSPPVQTQPGQPPGQTPPQQPEPPPASRTTTT